MLMGETFLFKGEKRSFILEPNTLGHGQEYTFRLAQVPCFNMAVVLLEFYSNRTKEGLHHDTLNT